MTTYLVYHGPVTIAGVKNVEILTIDAIASGERDITLCICSGGGDVSAGLGLYNYLRMLPVDINTLCFGMVGSIATTIYLAGTKRIASPTSYFQLHAAQYTSGAKSGQLCDDNHLIALPFKIQLGWSDELIERYLSNIDDQYLSVEEALSHGICTEIADIKFGLSDKVMSVSIP